MTRNDLQPARLDTNGNIRCDWTMDDGEHGFRAGFYCTACDWTGKVKVDPGDRPEDVRDRAAEMHDAEV